MKIARRGDRLTVHIENLAVGGRGVARHQGLVIFVADAAPNEEVEIELTLVKKNFAEGQLIRIIKSSPQRRSPPCPVAGVCGGCNWQHINYDEQLRQKRLLVEQSLRRMSGFEIADGLVAPVIPSPREFRYRNRIQLHHNSSRVGFHKKNSHEIIDIDDCLIADDAIAREIPQLKGELLSKPPGRIELYLTQTEKFAIRSHVEGADQPPAFSQVNSGQNINLVSFTIDALTEMFERLTSSRSTGLVSRRLYDFYAGMGNFTFPLAERLHQKAEIHAVEFNQQAVQLARQRAADEGFRIEFHQAAVEKFLEALPKEKLQGSLILLDPPRIGCAPEVMEAIAASDATGIVYVSCHPVTLARDLRLLKGSGFKLRKVQPFDMFSQTDHVETVVLAERS